MDAPCKVNNISNCWYKEENNGSQKAEQDANYSLCSFHDLWFDLLFLGEEKI